MAWGRESKLELDVEEPAEAHNLLYPVEIAKRRMRLGKHIDRAELGRLARRVDFGIGRELAPVALRELSILPERQLAGDEQQRSGAHGRDVVCDRRRRFGQNDAHFFQALGGLAHGRRGLLDLPAVARASAAAGGSRLCRLSGEGKLVFAFLRA